MTAVGSVNEFVDTNETLERVLLDDPPYGAAVSYRADEESTGWDAPPTARKDAVVANVLRDHAAAAAAGEL